jgi:hypothetical protein
MMSATLDAAVLQDDIAVSLARAVSAANRHATHLGVDVRASHLTVSEQTAAGNAVWRISYGPKDPVGRRGGDLIIDVDSRDGSIRQELRGQ